MAFDERDYISECVKRHQGGATISVSAGLVSRTLRCHPRLYFRLQCRVLRDEINTQLILHHSFLKRAQYKKKYLVY